MVTIRAYRPSDFEEVVDMYYRMCLEVYPHRTFKDKQYFYRNVIHWIEWHYDIMVTEKDGEITGFSLCYMDSMGGITEDFYHFECLYVKERFRKTRSAHLLVNTPIIYADSRNLIISANASNISECSNFVSRLGDKIFTTYERLPKKEEK